MNVFELMGSIELKDENFIRGVNNARRSMQQLQTAFNNSTRAVDRNVDRSMQNAGRSSNQGARRVETASDNMSQSLRQANRSFDSTARTASRDFEQLGTEAQRGSRRVEDSVDDAAKHSEKSVEKMSAGMIAKAQIMAQAVVGIVSKVADGAKQIATSAIEGYGNYQQLSGGIQKLYGNMGQSLIDYASANGQTVEEAKAQWQTLEKAQNTMIRNAKAGWKTAGMSANDYMQNVTGFSAALINSLGGDTQKAADIADMAMQDISDNVNTFGTGSVQDIADVYRAISKGQYQTLDNLNLGFAGTKEGMQKLIDKANELQKANGKAGELSVDSFSDIVEAIHEVQGSMSITGTTSREAMGTVEGSINMAKSAWQNFVAGLGDKDADMKQLADNLVEAGGAVLENLKPVVTQIFNSLWDVAKEEVPKLGEKIPVWIGDGLKRTMDLADKFLDAVNKAISGIKESDIANAVTKMGNTVTKAFTRLWPKMIHSASTLISKFASGIGKAAPSVLPGAVQAVIRELVRFIQQDAPQLLKSGMELMKGLAQGIIRSIPDVIRAIPELIHSIIDFLVENSDSVVDAFIDLFTEFIEHLPEIIEAIVEAIPQIIEAIVRLLIEGVPKAVEGFVKLLGGINEAVKKVEPEIKEATDKLIDKIKNGLEEGKHSIREKAAFIGWVIKKGINGELDDIEVESAEKIGAVNGALAAVTVNANPLANKLGTTISNSLTDGLKGIETAKNTAASAIAGIVPQHMRSMADNLGQMRDNFVERMHEISRASDDGWHGTTSSQKKNLEEMNSNTRDIFAKMTKTISQKTSEAKAHVKAAAQSMKSAFNFTFDKPKLQLPHITYQTKHVKFLGDIPDTNTLRVEWYRKAMNAPMLLDRATIFGAAGDRFLAGGEAGPEVVSGVNPLLNMMRNAASSGNGRRDAMLSMIVELLSQYLPDISTGQDPEALFQAFDRRLGEAMI